MNSPRYTWSFETGTATCARCHVSGQDLLTQDAAGQWHAAHQRHCRTPQQSTTTAKVLRFPTHWKGRQK